MKWQLPILVMLTVGLHLKDLCFAKPLDEWMDLQGEYTSLPDLIRIISGNEVLDWDGQSLNELRGVARSVLAHAKAAPIQANRINEAGNAVEVLVLEALATHGFETGRPRPPSGRRKTAGYPDIFASSADAYFFIEIKTYSPKTQDSSQRTFYISPSDDFKVARDGYHLLLAFSTIEIGDELYGLTGFKLLDLYGLECRLKMEFNASNRDLYRESAGLIIAED